VSITTPAQGAAYRQGEAVAAAYACATTAPVTIASCTGPVGDGAAIDTATLGAHSFTVSGIDSNGVATQASVDYTVLAVKPTLSDVHESATRWREHAGRGSRLPVGTAFTFTIPGSATVTLSFARHASGRMRGGHCVAPSHAPKRAQSCLRAIGAGELRMSVAAGSSRVAFAGHTAGGTLAPGNYTVTIVATGSGGGTSAAVTLRFTIAAPPPE
jgi:hypothetical protein